MTRVGKDVEKLEPLCFGGWECKNDAAAMENSLLVPQKYRITV